MWGVGWKLEVTWKLGSRLMGPAGDVQAKMWRLRGAKLKVTWKLGFTLRVRKLEVQAKM